MPSRSDIVAAFIGAARGLAAAGTSARLARPSAGARYYCGRADGTAGMSNGALARAIVAGRGRIGNYLDPALFADPAFDILLDLFASEEEGIKVNMTGCACAARIPRTTALRWVCTLEREGLVERYGDSTDQRLTLVRLTATARDALTNYLHQITASRQTR